ncbi:MAG: ATP-binding cassette domain-containing protein, partial [Actinobacteria bacterium]|nr:ATP-binding cassette domain-containing protein [Actinomycetota bacterium]
VLDDVHLDIPAGTRVGIVGRTGSGKTTLISLLTRFFDPTSGTILLDGRDVRRYRIDDLRQQFSMVMQDAVLFSASIGDNIAYARPNASHDDVVKAAKAAEAHDFITQMADGYETLVGERGLRLSGGERQRISLARAFLRDAPIVILDEPTSAVDTLTEKEIMAAFSRLMANRTVFMIAHRLSTLDDCDEVIRIDHGRVSRLDGPPGRQPHNKGIQTEDAPAGAHPGRHVH